MRSDTVSLRELWKEAFGDADEFLDLFFSTGFSPDRCHSIILDGETAAAAYWLPCTCQGRPFAYIYAVATAKKHRGKGLCRRLMADIHETLKNQGYAGAILVPQDEGLRRMYAGFGYRDGASIREFTAVASPAPVSLRQINGIEYAEARRSLLPPDAVLQEGSSLAFLETQIRFYTGAGFVLAATLKNGNLFAPELLGKADPGGILKALDAKDGTFRTIGGSEPFAMFLPLMGNCPVPGHFAFAFD